jgi:hypothetical protein
MAGMNIIPVLFAGGSSTGLRQVAYAVHAIRRSKTSRPEQRLPQVAAAVAVREGTSTVK